MRNITTGKLLVLLWVLALLLVASVALARSWWSFEVRGDWVESGSWYSPASCLVSSELNCDCQVDLGDVVRVASAWRCRTGDDCCDAHRDVNDDGAIDGGDVAFVAMRWGEICS